MLTNGIIRAIHWHDTLRPLGIKFRPSQIVYVTLNIINNVMGSYNEEMFKKRTFVSHKAFQILCENWSLYSKD